MNNKFHSFWLQRLSVGVRHLKDDATGTLHALEKSPGVMSHPNKILSSPSSSRVKANLNESIVNDAYYDFVQNMYLPSRKEHDCERVEAFPTDNFLWLLHRLDSATSGVILVSTEKKTAKNVFNAFKKRNGVRKTYVACVLGQIATKFFGSQVWTDYIRVDKQGDVIKAVSGQSNQQRLKAVTEMKYLRSVQLTRQLRIHLIELKPITGFTHQLRFQCAVRGLQILGDKKYGNFALSQEGLTLLKSRCSDSKITNTGDFKRLFLHAIQIDVQIPGQDNFSASSAIPAEFEAIMSLEANCKLSK